MKMFKKFIQIIQDEVIGTDNRYIAVAWAVCLAGLVGVGIYLTSESMSFLGVADSRELQVNFEYPVEIKRIHVIAGQLVKKGDLIAELNQSELNGQIRVVRSQMARLESELRVREHLNAIVNNSSGEFSSDPLQVEIADFKAELSYLENQKKNLYVFAEVDGIIGEVNFRKGEKVPSFTSLVTLSPENPSYVQGFVHESLHTKLEIGRHVSVLPLSTGNAPIEGKIVSIGSRIILMPPRLMPNPMMQAYGREVVVEIPSHNHLLLGEKVQIKPKIELLFVSTASAAQMKAASEAVQKIKGTVVPENVPDIMRVPAQLSQRFSFEPSGVVYLEDLKRFLVVSDDTDDDKSAALFLVDRDGLVDDQTIQIPGVDKISDLESISQEGNRLYLLTSQGLTKKGKDKKDRNLFLRMKRSGLDISELQKVDFKPLLIAAIRASKDVSLKAIFAGALKNGDMEIESHFIDSGNVYVGFKSPQTEKGESVILQLKDVDALFNKKTIGSGQLSLWKKLDFGSGHGAPHRLSDLVKISGKLYATTVCQSEDCGAVWKLTEDGDVLRPEQIRLFEDLRPEGLAFDPNDSSLFVTFDQKDEAARYLHIPLQPSAEAKPAKQ